MNKVRYWLRQMGVFTVGAGFANTESAGSPALMLNYVAN
jgi:hypothetical protein